MSEGRARWFGSVSGIGLACLACASPFGAGCGEAFTAGPADSGRPGTSVPPSDAAITDARSGDAGGTGDAAAVDAGPGWCASQSTGHTFCEDFLHGVPDQLVEFAVGGSIAADTTDYATPPQSMATSSPSLPKGASATAIASHDLSKANGTQFTIATFFKVASSCFPSNGQPNPATILALNFTEANYELVVAVLPSAVELIEVTSDPDAGTMKVQPQTVQATGLLDTWVNWTLDVTGGFTTKTATLTVGKAVLFDKVSLKNAPIVGLLQHPLAYFGLAAKNEGSFPLPACKVGVDDILIDVRSAAITN